MAKITYFDQDGYREVQSGPSQAEQLQGLQRGLGALQQQQQFQRKVELEKQQLNQEYQIAELKARKAAVLEAEKAANDQVLLEAYVQKQQAIEQMDPEQKEQAKRSEILKNLQGPQASVVAAKLDAAWTAQDERKQYLASAQDLQRQISGFAEEGLLSEQEAQSANMELEQRVSSGGDLSAITQGIQKKRQANVEAIEKEEDWQEVIEYAQEAMPYLPGDQRAMLRSAATDFRAHRTARDGEDPWKFKSKVEAALQGTVEQKQFQHGIMDRLGVGASPTPGGLPGFNSTPDVQPGPASARAPQVEGQSPQESQENAQRGFPGADPANPEDYTQADMARLLGLEEEVKALAKKKADRDRENRKPMPKYLP